MSHKLSHILYEKNSNYFSLLIDFMVWPSSEKQLVHGNANLMPTRQEID